MSVVIEYVRINRVNAPILIFVTKAVRVSRYVIDFSAFTAESNPLNGRILRRV